MKNLSAVSLTLLIFAGLLLLWTSPVLADEGEDQRVSGLLEALELPVEAQKLRESGMPDAEVDRALQTLRERTEPAEEAEEAHPRQRRAAEAAAVLRSERRTAEKYGSMENFGDFVRAQVEEGRRGEELARSIRSQQENRRPAASERETPGEDRGQRGERPGSADEAAHRDRGPRGERDRTRERRQERTAGEGDDRQRRERSPRADRPQPRGERQVGARGDEEQSDDAEEEESEPDSPGSRGRDRGRSNR